METRQRNSQSAKEKLFHPRNGLLKKHQLLELRLWLICLINSSRYLWWIWLQKWLNISGCTLRWPPPPTKIQYIEESTVHWSMGPSNSKQMLFFLATSLPLPLMHLAWANWPPGHADGSRSNWTHRSGEFDKADGLAGSWPMMWVLGLPNHKTWKASHYH